MIFVKFLFPPNLRRIEGDKKRLLLVEYNCKCD